MTLTPEEAAAVAAALSTRPAGQFAAAGRGALEKVLEVLEPDPRRRAQLLARSLEVSARADGGAPPAGRHPAGRALHRPPAAGPPRLVVLPGGRT